MTAEEYNEAVKAIASSGLGLKEIEKAAENFKKAMRVNKRNREIMRAARELGVPTKVFENLIEKRNDTKKR
jgi:isopentenyl diphosphate isomerase/L-lactate dehydrogenase-like FMN-dependent dehydrogenase